MEWEKRLKELNGYNISFEIKQGYYHIALTFDDGWNILTPENEFIYVEERNNVYHYIASTDNVKIEDMFNAIDATIDFNMDLQKKLILFKQKTEELQELFANKDFETLQTIEFKIKEKKETKKTTNKTKSNVKTKTTKKTKTSKKKNTTNKTEVDKSENKIQETKQETPNYDNEEIVTLNETYFQELERE